MEEWEKQVPGPAFLKEYKAKPLATFKFNLRHSKGFDAVLSVMGWFHGSLVSCTTSSHCSAPGEI